MHLHVALFGTFRVLCDGQPIPGLDSQKVQELFSYLLLHLNHPVPRETLAGILWGNTSTAQSKKYLRQTLWQLRSALDSQGENASDRLLLLEPDSICLVPCDGLRLDIAEFEQAYAPITTVSGEHLGDSEFQSLQHAARLYQGDLLEGWYQDWCLYERERLQDLYLMLLGKLIACCEWRGQLDEGISYATALLRYDPAHELTHARLMRLYYLAGDRTSALRQYKHCVEALDKELNVSPSERTVALYEQIRSDLSLGASQDAATGQLPASARRSVLDLVSRLKQLETAIAGVHYAMHRDLETIEHIMDDHQ